MITVWLVMPMLWVPVRAVPMPPVRWQPMVQQTAPPHPTKRIVLPQFETRAWIT
jgi:hypothetical protein